MRDYTNLFNTYLPPEQEAMFDAWLVNESIRQGHVLVECTLEARNPASSGMMADLTASA